MRIEAVLFSSISKPGFFTQKRRTTIRCKRFSLVQPTGSLLFSQVAATLAGAYRAQVNIAGSFFRSYDLVRLRRIDSPTPPITLPLVQVLERPSTMVALDWQVIAEIATTVSTIAFAASAIVVVVQLRQAARERYFAVTAHLFEIWQSPEFQHDQLFLLHKLQNPSWEDFCAQGRGERAERALHRVGGYYDRVGNLVRHNLIRKDDILPTIGGYAVAVWQRIAPLVKELRLRENAVLFENLRGFAARVSRVLRARNRAA
jgi:hypothetical protein